MTKNQKANRVLVEENIKNLLAPVKKATELGKWEGVDGAKQYIESSRITSLENRYGRKFKEEAMNILFHEIAKISEKNLEKEVLENFVQNYPNVFTKYNNLYPNFSSEYPNAVKFCKNALKHPSKK